MSNHSPELPDLLHEHIGSARWFGGKGRDFEVGDVRRIPLRSGRTGEPEDPDVTVMLVEVAYEDGAGDVYQVAVASYAAPQDRIEHALIGEHEDRHLYDAVHDRFAMAAWLEAFAGADAEPGLAFRRVGRPELDTEVHSTLLSAEQSNSSVAFGEDSLLKFFRRVTPGINPDIEILHALTDAGSSHVAALYGWVELPGDSSAEVVHLGMLQQFLRTASDGWELALASVRNLYMEADLYAGEVGGDFAGEAHRLGVAVAEIHDQLRASFPTGQLDAVATTKAMHERLDAAVEIVPELAARTPALGAIMDAVRDCGGDAQRAQRVHGDLHLGQTLRTSLGWKLVDFEGEPAKPLAERRRPDSPWRDVAGMLRSFDYAARIVERDLAEPSAEGAQIGYRAEEWVARNSEAFLTGYAEVLGRPLTGQEETLIAAYVVDKAIYETVYEARNRPGWQDIPLAAIQRLTEVEEP